MNLIVPQLAEVVERRAEVRNIYTLRLRLCDQEERRSFRFSPGQFNMLYAFGGGEIPISIASDPGETEILDHTIRSVGNVSRLFENYKVGDKIGLRGPFGSHWPMEEAKGREVLIITGGLGCAPVTAAIDYIIKRRSDYGPLKILHGVKAPKDLLYQKKFKLWEKIPNTEVFLTSDKPGQHWKYRLGVVTNLIPELKFNPAQSIVLMCGPEIMLRTSARELVKRGVSPDQIYLAMERNMKCAIGFCGHCQFGPQFVCKDGPILRYDRIQHFLSIREV